jgi:hypothetical protein
MFLLVVSISSLVLAIAAAAYAWRLASAERVRSEARVAALAAAIDDTPEGAPPSMFDASPRAGLQGRPLLKVGVGFVMAVLVIVLIAMNGDRHRTAAESARPAPSESTGAARSDSAQSLELLSMRHVRTGDTLSVTGLVRNRGAASSGAVMAVVFVFDRDGGFVASGRAPLEFTGIANGDESPFQVTIPDVTDVGRYRVSFRTDAGIVPHVDRRPALQVSN